MTVDEQGVEMLHKRCKHLNKDLNMVQQPVRAKTASKKRKKIKEITKNIEEQKPYINKSQVLASSEHPIVSKTGAGMDETYYSDSRSINKSHINSSVFGINEGLGRFVKENKAQNQILNSNPSIFAIKQNALCKVDSVYSSNNVPTIKDIKSKRMRPMSMKQPRKLRQKI